MDHAVTTTRTIETPWRTAALVAAAVAAVELFILVLVGVVFSAKLVSDHAEKAITTAAQPPAPTKTDETARARTPASKTHAGPQLSRRETAIIVLNGNGIPGAAAVTAEKLRHFHYLIAATGNAPRSDFAQSVVMYRKGFEAEAARLKHDLHIRRIGPLDGLKPGDLQGAHLALIIGG